MSGSGQAATVPLTPASDQLRADVLIVGSGAGGATTAAILAEGGLDVLVVEEGEWVEQNSVVPFSLEQMDRQYRAGGVTVALGRPSIAYAEGRCAGGGTEINSGLYWRPPAELLARWRDTFAIDEFDPEALGTIADEVEADLRVTLSGEPTAPSEALARGARALGWRGQDVPRWMADEPGGRPQRQSMTKTYLPRAVRAGARLVTGCRIDRLVTTGGRATHAEATLGGGRKVTIRFGAAFVCGGAIQSPALLQRSGIEGRIGRTLAVHPTIKVAARFDERLNVPDDVPVHQVKEFTPQLSFGGSASNAGLVALALLDQWPTFREAITDWERMSIYYAAITSEGLGRVRALPRLRDPLVTYRLTGRDKQLLRSGMARLALLLLEAGATDVFPSVRGAPIVRGRADLAELQAGFRATRASVMTVHLCSTVPMSDDSRRGGADSFGRVHGCANVYVNDASLLPTAPGVNPQASVMVVAIRNARHFLREGNRRA